MRYIALLPRHIYLPESIYTGLTSMIRENMLMVNDRNTDANGVYITCQVVKLHNYIIFDENNLGTLFFYCLKMHKSDA